MTLNDDIFQKNATAILIFNTDHLRILHNVQLLKPVHKGLSTILDSIVFNWYAIYNETVEEIDLVASVRNSKNLINLMPIIEVIQRLRLWLKDLQSTKVRNMPELIQRMGSGFVI